VAYILVKDDSESFCAGRCPMRQLKKIPISHFATTSTPLRSDVMMTSAPTDALQVASCKLQVAKTHHNTSRGSSWITAEELV